MSIREERNIATLLRWKNEVWGQRRLELAPELVAPEYLGFGPRGLQRSTPEAHATALLQLKRGNEEAEFKEIIARGDFVAVRWAAVDPPPDPLAIGGLQVYQFDDEHRIRAMWSGPRYPSAGPWPDDGEPARWLIADGDLATEEERRNARTRQLYLERRLANDPTGLDELFADPVPSHSPTRDRLETVSDFAERIQSESARYPNKRFVEHVHFVVGDRSVEVWGWRWDDANAPVWNGAQLKSPWEFIEIWRYEDGRIAERWQVTAEPGVDWGVEAS